MSKSLSQEIRALIEDAQRAQPYRPHTSVGLQEPTAYVKTPMERSALLPLSTTTLPEVTNGSARFKAGPPAAPAGQEITMSASLASSSRIAQAGARLIVLPDNRTAISDLSGGIALQEIPFEFRNVEAAEFGTVDIDAEDDAPVIALPVFGESMTADQFIAKAVRFELPRSEWKKIGTKVLADEIALTLTLGIARAADEMLLSAIAAETPSAFTLTKAATRGLRFGELAAIVGTAGNGAVVGQDGTLRAAGVGAELSPDVAGTYVGAWGRAGVVLREEVAVTVERITKNGELAVTAWIAGRPLVPDASCFWTVAGGL